jgi:hypothetical protein
MLMPSFEINALRPPFSARHLLCGLPSVTIQTRLKPAHGRFFSLHSRRKAKNKNSLGREFS